MAIITSMTDEQIAYAYEYCHVKIHEHHIVGITKEDIEDMLQFCLGNLAKRYKYDDSRGTKWTTYIQACCRTILIDAYKWHYRNHQRIPLYSMDYVEAEPVVEEDLYTHLEDIVDDPLLRELCKMKYEHVHELKIRAKLNLSKVEYVDAMMRLHDVLRHKHKEN